MTVRLERHSDTEAIGKVHLEAFDTKAEANLVEALRTTGIELISLVAEVNKKIIGHILFSPVTIKGNFKAMGLGPMAVLPDWQRKGVGTRLINEGLKACTGAGYELVVVLGHPEYYPRFGFVPADQFGIISEFDVPPEAFMVQELQKGILKRLNGKVKYHILFDALA